MHSTRTTTWFSWSAWVSVILIRTKVHWNNLKKPIQTKVNWINTRTPIQTKIHLKNPRTTLKPVSNDSLNHARVSWAENKTRVNIKCSTPGELGEVRQK